MQPASDSLNTSETNNSSSSDVVKPFKLSFLSKSSASANPKTNEASAASYKPMEAVHDEENEIELGEVIRPEKLSLSTPGNTNTKSQSLFKSDENYSNPNPGKQNDQIPKL